MHDGREITRVPAVLSSVGVHDRPKITQVLAVLSSVGVHDGHKITQPCTQTHTWFTCENMTSAGRTSSLG